MLIKKILYKIKIMKFLFLIASCCLFFLGHAEREPKTLVLIICSEGLPIYKEFKEVWRSYMHLDPDHFECYFIRANPRLCSETLIEKDEIWSKTEENLIPGILNKTLMSLELLLPRLHEFDFVLRTNLSSFFVFPNLLSFLRNVPREKLYCGIPHQFYNPPNKWVCGAGIVLSIDLVRELVANKQSMMDLKGKGELDVDYYPDVDDVVIGNFFHQKGIQITPGKYLEIHNNWEYVKDNIPDDIYHFRIKSLPPLERENDLAIQKVLLKKYYNKKI